MFATLVSYSFSKDNENLIGFGREDISSILYTNQPQSDKVSNNTQKGKRLDNYIVKSFKTSNGWGYQILKDKKVLINQPTIPVIEGNKAFSSKKEALKVANLVKVKLEKGQFPPSVTKSQIDSLKITY